MMRLSGLAILGSLIFLSSLAQAQCNLSLRIGFITGLSGEGKVWGDAVKNGFELGLAEAGCGQMVRIYEDDQFAPAKSVSAFRKLVESDGVNVVVVTSSAPGNAVAPIAQEQNIPLFAWASDVMVSRNRSYVIRTWSSGEDEGEFIASTARTLNYRRISGLSSVHDYPASVLKGLEKGLSPGATLAHTDVPAEARDFRTEITRIRSYAPDALYTCLMTPGVSGILARQLKQLKVTIPIFGCEALELGSNFKQSQGALSGAWFVTGGVRSDFESRFKTLYGEPGSLPGAAIHYDLARILSETKSGGGSDLVDEVLSHRWQARAVQDIVPFRGEGDQALKVKLAVKRYARDGQIVD
jgi:branched-chain amino acid transport system substrate-binding protein